MASDGSHVLSALVKQRTSQIHWPATLLCVTLAVALLILAAWLGARSPWGVKHPTAKHGAAVRVADEALIMFDAADGTQLDLPTDTIRWFRGDESGKGDPPCLDAPSRKTDVTVGVLKVATPSGGWFEQAVWVECPT